MIKLLLGLVKTSTAGMQQACSKSGADVWNEMLPVRLVLCPREETLPSSKCNLTQFSSRAAVPEHILVEGSSEWVTWPHSTLSPCRHRLAHRGTQGQLIICCCKQGWRLLVVKAAGTGSVMEPYHNIKRDVGRGHPAAAPAPAAGPEAREVTILMHSY